MPHPRSFVATKSRAVAGASNEGGRRQETRVVCLASMLDSGGRSPINECSCPGGERIKQGGGSASGREVEPVGQSGQLEHALRVAGNVLEREGDAPRLEIGRASCRKE